MRNIFKIIFALGFIAVASSVSAATLSKPSNNLGLVGYWSFEDATSTASVGTKATDFSGRGNTGTLTNGPTWVDGKRGKALNFDGTDDYVSVPNLDYNTFSYSAWIKRGRVSQSGNNDRLFLSINSNGWGIYFVSDGSANSNKIGFTKVGVSNTTSSGSISDTDWHHLTVTYDGSNVRFFIDGILDSSPSYSATFGGGAGYTIGSRGAGEYFQGKFDEVRVYSRALSATEVSALYGAGAQKFVAPSKTGLVGYWSFDDATSTKATDLSGNGNAGTLANMDPATDWVLGKRGRALDFDGADDYVSVADSNSLDMGDTFTLAAFVKRNAISTKQQIINKGTNGYVLGFLADNTLEFGKDNVATVVQSNVAVTDNDWHHVSVTKNGSSVALYIDGVDVTGTVNNQTIENTGSNLSLGRHFSNTFFLNGRIDEVRIYNRALSAAEIAALAGAGAQKINASQNRTGSSLDTDLIGIWSFNGQDISGTTAYDRSGNGNNGTISGAVPALGKVGQALRFDGADDYVTIPDSPLWDFSGAFTWSAWMKLTSAPGQWDGVISRDGTSPYPIYLRFADGTSIDFSINNTGGLTYAVSPVLNRWYHIVALWDGSSTKRIYLDGVEVAQNSQLAAPTATNDPLYIGLDYLPGNSRNFPGYIDEVRVYNRALSASEVKQLYNLGK